MVDLPELNWKERKILTVLAEISHRRGPDKCFPGMAYLARRAGCGERTASRAMSILKAAGYVQQIQRGRTSCRYVLTVEIDFGGPVAGQAGQAQAISIQSRTEKYGGASGGANPFINTPLPPAEPARPSLNFAKVSDDMSPECKPKGAAMQRPTYYRTTEEIQLWDLAQRWMLEHPDVLVEANHVGHLMEALEDAGALRGTQMPTLTHPRFCSQPERKPAGSEQAVELLRKAIL